MHGPLNQIKEFGNKSDSGKQLKILNRRVLVLTFFF